MSRDSIQAPSTEVIGDNLCHPIERLAEVKQETGFSLTNISECMTTLLEQEVSRSTVSRWVSGYTTPSWPQGEAVLKLCDLVEALLKEGFDSDGLQGSGIVDRVLESMDTATGAKQ